jgi:xanthine dehydrogenase accessory factor
LDAKTISAETDPRPHLVIVGPEKTGRILAGLAHLLNFEVTVIDPLLTMGEVQGADRVLSNLDFSKVPMSRETFVVIASGGRLDDEAVEQAVLSGARYIALVANQKRAREVLRRVSERGVDIHNVRTRAGIDIQAQGPAEIALSILAEIVAERHRFKSVEPAAR